MFSQPAKNLERLRLEEGMDVADLGAGTGYYSIPAARLIGSGKVYAIEVQKELLPRLKNTATAEGVHNIEVVWGDVERLGGTRLRDASVDAVIASNILFQVEDKNGFAGEVSRILKSGGRLLLIDWSEAGVAGGPLQGHAFFPQDAERLFLMKGFRRETAFDAGSHHYGFIFVK